jgi:hypothetical protein
VALHRYHGVEQAQREMVERHAQERKQIRQKLETSKIEFQQRP